MVAKENSCASLSDVAVGAPNPSVSKTMTLHFFPSASSMSKGSPRPVVHSVGSSFNSMQYSFFYKVFLVDIGTNSLHMQMPLVQASTVGPTVNPVSGRPSRQFIKKDFPLR
jgi:hypothetical protein